jgi:hypothetical protein
MYVPACARQLTVQEPRLFVKMASVFSVGGAHLLQKISPNA